MTSTYNTLITGANRGIGRGLLELYLAQPNQLVIAAVRDAESKSSLELLNLLAGEGSSLVVIRIDSAIQADPGSAVKTLQTRYRVEHLDLVIANAGISYTFPFIADLKVEDLGKHIETNVHGPLWLFQATLSLLQKGKAPKWMAMSSSAGSLASMGEMQHPNAAYGASKALLNFHTLKIHFEHPNIAAVALDPGFVQTEMGNAGAIKLGFEKAFITVDEACSGLKKVIDGVSRESHSGKFLGYDGLEKQW